LDPGIQAKRSLVGRGPFQEPDRGYSCHWAEATVVREGVLEAAPEKQG
jgi:hypothetical protein